MMGDHPQMIPEFVEAQISQLVSRNGFAREYVLQEYLKAYQASMQKVALAFPNADPAVVVGQRQRIAISTVYTSLQNSPPTSKYDVVYLGHGGLRYSRGSKKPYCTMYVGCKDVDQLRIFRLGANDKYAEIYKSLQPLQIYTSTLARYRPADGRLGDFLFDYRCEFITSRPSGLDVTKLCQTFNIPIRTIGDLMMNPPKLNDAGYPDEKDWQCIFGNLSGPAKVYADKKEINLKGEGAMKGWCKITDLTVADSPYTDTSNYMVYPGIDCHAAAELMALDDSAYCAWIGPVGIKQDKNSGKLVGSMTSYMIVPIFSMTQAIQES